VTTILHLVPEAVWRGVRRDRPWAPQSLTDEGFVHCTGDDDLLLVVANRFYADAPGPLVALTLAVDRLGSEVRWEAPAHPDGSAVADDDPRFPHVYGPIDPRAVTAVRRVVRIGDRYVGYEPATH
jgi:uncharacterized protein (DUF952 family)